MQNRRARFSWLGREPRRSAAWDFARSRRTGRIRCVARHIWSSPFEMARPADSRHGGGPATFASGGNLQSESGITAVAHVIQLSVAPVFLLSAVAAMLAVMINR